MLRQIDCKNDIKQNVCVICTRLSVWKSKNHSQQQNLKKVCLKRTAHCKKSQLIRKLFVPLGNHIYSNQQLLSSDSPARTWLLAQSVSSISSPSYSHKQLVSDVEGPKSTRRIVRRWFKAELALKFLTPCAPCCTRRETELCVLASTSSDFVSLPSALVDTWTRRRHRLQSKILRNSLLKAGFMPA